MKVQFHKTISVDENHYIDLLTVNDVLMTMLMTKIAEPNVFGVLKQEDGDTTATIANEIIVLESSR